MKKVKSTTVCAVLKDGKIAIGADGQATMGNTVAKSNVNKIRVLHEGKILAGFAGIVIPLFLDKLRVDPALASAVILTTITDVFGFLSFLGLATLFLI